MKQKLYLIKKIFCHHNKRFLLKNPFKETTQYLLNIFILFNTVSYFKPKTHRKKRTFKNLEKFKKKRVATLFKSLDILVFSQL